MVLLHSRLVLYSVANNLFIRVYLIPGFRRVQAIFFRANTVTVYESDLT